jgi:hypothetical protein
MSVSIPALCPHPVNTANVGSYVSSQPIIQLKELEVDRVRYDQWKASLLKTKIKRTAKSKQSGTGLR